MPKSIAPMILNGSHGEGGSALFRTALSVAALTQQPVRVHTIRGGTRKPGITSEDLSFVTALTAISDAEVTGDELGSVDLTFAPRRLPRGFRGTIDIGAFEKSNVPGNALIVAESLIPVLARAGMTSQFKVIGETHNPNTLSFDVFERVSLSAHRRQGIYAYTNLVRSGFGYASKGEVGIEVEPSVPLPLDWSSRGHFMRVCCIVSTSQVSESVLPRGASTAQDLLKKNGLEGEVEVVNAEGREPGAMVTFFAEFERGIGAATSSGTKGVRIESVVHRCFESFTEWFRTDSTVDPYLADQLLLPAALADGGTQYKTSMVTRRLITMAWVIKQFVPIHITILGREGEPGTVTVNRS